MNNQINDVELNKYFTKKLENIKNISKLQLRLEFLEKLEKITLKQPFLYLPYFISDFISGISKTELYNKYHFVNYLNLEKIIEILGFKHERYLKKNYPNAKIMNLKIPGWEKIHSFLIDNCNYFENELNQFYFEKFLYPYVFLKMMDYKENGADVQTLVQVCKNNINDFYIFRFFDQRLNHLFLNFLNHELGKKILYILDNFLDKGIIKRKKGKSGFFINPLTIERVKSIIITILEVESNGLRRGVFPSRLELFEPGLKEIHGLGIWEYALHNLEHEKKIISEKKFYYVDSDIIYLSKDYIKIKQRLDELTKTNIKFFGRKISPERFINELEDLEKGDFNDKDDQVTRIAGLVLAESVKLYPPHEKIPEFDFTIDLANYNFRPEQLEAMTKINFKMQSQIIHCKVMINEILSLEKYNKIKTMVPKNEQAVIITFRQIPEAVKQLLSINPSIQIVDEEGIKIWVSITSVIPSRKNTVAKLYYDPLSKLKNKIVKINSIDYEKGLANVEIFPEMQEALVLIRTLEEIPLHESSLNEHEIMTQNYLTFLKKLIIIASDTFEEGLILQIKSTEKKLGKYGDDVPVIVKNAWIFELDHIKLEIDLNRNTPRSIFKCGCYYMINPEHSGTLCKHIVSGLNYLTIQYFLIHEWNSKRNLIEHAMTSFLEMDVNSTIQRIAIDLNQKELNLFKNYLENYANLIESKKL